MIEWQRGVYSGKSSLLESNITQTEVVNIFISTNKLVGMGIDPKQLASLLQSQNQIINTGEIRAGEQQLRVTANGG